MILFISGLVLFFIGLWLHALGMAVIGAGVWCIASVDMMGDSVLRSWFSRLFYIVKFIYARYNIWRDAPVIEQARTWCEAYARLHPLWISAPFRLLRDHHVTFALEKQDRLAPFKKESVPQSVEDLGMVLADRGIVFLDLRSLWLAVNQEIWKNERYRLYQNVFCTDLGKMDSDLDQIFLRFANQNTPFSRQVFFEMVLEDYSVSFIAQYFNLTYHRLSWFVSAKDILDKAIHVAVMDQLAKVRQIELERALFETSSYEHVMKLKQQDVQGILSTLEQVFAPENVDVHEVDEGLVNNYFVVRYADVRIVFHLGFPLQLGEINNAVIDQAAENCRLHTAQKVVLLALAPLQESVVAYADKNHVLVVSQESLEQLLTDHELIVKERIAWTLLASEKNVSKGLELGVVT